MKPLIEELHDNNVIFSYYGFIDSSVLNEVLEITKSKLQGNRESPDTVDKVYNAINDCVDNIIRHNFYPDDARVRYKSLLVVSKLDGKYEIDTLNVVNEAQKRSLDEQLAYLQNRTRQELIELKSGHQVPDKACGLIELTLKADQCEYSFKPLQENHLFNISYKIASAN